MEHKWQGRFLNTIYNDDKIDLAMTFSWLKWENIPVEVEVGMFDLQAQTLKTRLFDKVRGMPVSTLLCRMCGDHEENIPHIVAGCRLWNFTYYLERHNAALKPVCWWLRKKYGLDEEMKSWSASVSPDPVSQNENICIWWDVPVMSDANLEHNRVDMRVWLKHSNEHFLVEMCTPWDGNIHKQRKEKEYRYRPLAQDIAVKYGKHARVDIICLVIGALGTVGDLMVELERLVRDKRETRIVGERMQKATICKTLQLVNRFKAQ